MLEEALEHLVKGIVDHPEDVQVRERDLRRGGCCRCECTPATLVE